MTVAPLPRPQPSRLATATTMARTRQPSTRLVTRRRHVALLKLLLPVLALMLLSTMVLWPQISREFGGRIAVAGSALSGTLQAGQLLDARYHGVDAHNEPYTVTAETAEQVGPERVNLAQPKGDAVSQSGTWTYSQSDHGVYMQRTGVMDMFGHVTLYRDTGMTLTTSAATMDMKSGAASGNAATHVEGPFGTLDAQGFAVVDKGNTIQFDGKSRLVLSGSKR